MTTTAISQIELDRCHRITGPDGKVFYKVESESGQVDPDGNTLEYTVRFQKGKGFTCTCPAGASGFRYCTHGTCKHCRWAAAHAEAYRQERREQAALESLVRQGVSREVAQCITYANDHPYQYSELEVKRAMHRNQREAFSILR